MGHTHFPYPSHLRPHILFVDSSMFYVFPVWTQYHNNIYTFIEYQIYTRYLASQKRLIYFLWYIHEWNVNSDMMICSVKCNWDITRGAILRTTFIVTARRVSGRPRGKSQFNQMDKILFSDKNKGKWHKSMTRGTSYPDIKSIHVT